MAPEDGKHQQTKISPEFAARLDRLDPFQKVRVIVLLCLDNALGTSTKRQSPAERQAIIDAVREAAQAKLLEIDRVLEQFGGKRLAPTVDALGSLPIETTVAGINALAASEQVKAILEDQTILPFTELKY